MVGRCAAKNCPDEECRPFRCVRSDIGPATPLYKQCNATQDQRAHDPLTQFGLGDQQRPHPVGREDQRLDRLGNDAVAERRPAGELRQFANERAGAEFVKVLALAVGVVAVNVNLAAENDGEAEADFANGRQRVARREAAYSPTEGALDIRRVEMREDLVASRLDDKRAGFAHIGTFWWATTGLIYRRSAPPGYPRTLIGEDDAAMVRPTDQPAAAAGNPTVRWGVAKW